MENLSFVNIYGQPLLSVLILSDAAPAKKNKKRKLLESYHRGWRVVGLSAEHVDLAQKKHERKRREQKYMDRLRPKQILSPWNEECWVAKARLRKIRPVDFEVQEAAHQYADLARKAGWMRVEVREIKKAGPKAYSDLFSSLAEFANQRHQ
jgi:hypothetical protein